MPHVILIGPMGVGKTTIGRELSRRLNQPCADTDQIIEERTQQSISDIFVERGEAHFRELEAAVVEELLAHPGVLSLGGGACVSAKAQGLIRNAHSKVVFLDITLSEVSKRVGFDKARPLLAINPRSRWQELMNERRGIYEDLADLTIVVDGKSVGEIADEIMVHL